MERFKIIKKSIIKIPMIHFNRFKNLIRVFKNSKQKIDSTPCLACGNEYFVPVTQLIQKSGINVICCIDCGLGKLDPMPSEKFYDNYYQKRYYKPKTVNLPSQRGLFIKEFIQEYKDRISGIFEIGVGAGRNLKAFEDIKDKIKIGGIDPSDLALQQAEKLGIHTFKGKSKDLNKYMLKEYNLIIFAHVLEHFTNPIKELLNIIDITSPNSYYYIEVPNSETPYYKFGLTIWFKLAHTYYFTPHSIELIFKKCGLSIIKIKKKEYELVYLLKKSDLHSSKPHISEKSQLGMQQIRLYQKVMLRSIPYMISDIKTRIQEMIKRIL